LLLVKQIKGVSALAVQSGFDRDISRTHYGYF